MIMFSKNVTLFVGAGLVFFAGVSLRGQVAPAPPVPPPAPLLVPPSVAATNPPPAGAPKLQFATNTFDFGRVPVGTVVKATFNLTNTGSAPLEILNVQPGCGCTTAGTWDRRVEPGRTTTLSLQLNTANFGGPITKTATVTCNDPTQSTTYLFIRGEVWKPVDVQPNVVMFNLTSDQTNSEVRSVRVVNNTEQDMTLEEPASSHAAFKLAVKPVRPGKEFDVQISASPSGLTGPVQLPMSLRTSLANVPTINFTVIASVQPALQAMPGEVVLPPGPLTGPTVFTISVRNNATDPVTVSEASLNVTNATVNLTQVQPGRFYNLALSFPAGFVLKPGEPAQLAFKTTNPRYPMMQVPIRMLPPPPAPLAPGPVTVPH
jgi:hypothetical protein